MSRFQKIVSVLIIILIIEILLILYFYTTKEHSLSSYDPNKKITILVDITANELAVFQNDKLLKTYTVATGKSSTPSPIGTWTIISKDTWGEGFGGRWMGFNVPWGKYGIHGTLYPTSIGWNSSHGCIRMHNNDVVELYKIASIGTKVIVTGIPYTNFSSDLRVLKPGMMGSDIFELQEILKSKGYYTGKPDGIYGESMKYYVHKFQKDNHLYVSDTIYNTFYKKLGLNPID